MLNSTIVANINGGLPPGQKISSGLHSSILMSDVDFAVTEVKTNTSANDQQKYLQKIGGKGSTNMIFNGHGKGMNFLDSNRNPQPKPARFVNGNKNGMDLVDEEGPSPKVCLYLGKISSEWQQSHKIGAGLINLGNTCFMNTVLQCLTYCAPLANYLLHESNHSTKCKITGFCMMCELQRHMRRVFERPGEVVKPVHIYHKLKSIAKHFQFGRQEDAHEFLRYVIDNMCKSCILNYDGHVKLDPASKETTVINKIFGGYHRSQVMCLRCKEKNNTYDHFMDLILDVKQNVLTLEKALEKFTQPELLQNDNAYKCLHCKMKVSAQKKFSIYAPPNVATFQLKRFDYNRICGGKITKHISYPEVLNLRPYMSNPKGSPMWYRLNAVLVHLGATCNSGHYYCFVRNSNGFWYIMDDTRVQQVSLNQVLNQVAYVLFYVRTNTSETVNAKRPAETSTSTLKNNQFAKNGFIGSPSCSVSTNSIPRPSLNLKSSALPPISKLTVSSSSSAMITNTTSNNIYQKRALQPLSQNREKVAFSIGSAKGKLSKPPTPQATNSVKNESPLSKGLVNGNMLVPYIEDSSESSDEESRNESDKVTPKCASIPLPPANLNNAVLSTGSDKFSNNNSYSNNGDCHKMSTSVLGVEVKAKSRCSPNFKETFKYNGVSSGATSFSMNSAAKPLHCKTSVFENSLKKENCSKMPKLCGTNEEGKSSDSDITLERKTKSIGPSFNLNRSVELNSGVTGLPKVNATMQWNIIDANTKSPSIASNSSTNSVNSTTDWNVTDNEQGARRKSEMKMNQGWMPPIKNIDKSNKDLKMASDTKRQKANVTTINNFTETKVLKPCNSLDDKEKHFDTDEMNETLLHKDKNQDLKSSRNLIIPLPFNDVCDSGVKSSDVENTGTVQKKPEKQNSSPCKDIKKPLFLAQQQKTNQDQTFQFRPNYSFLESSGQQSDTRKNTENERQKSHKRCFSDAVEDSCKERISGLPDHCENGHGSMSEKLKMDDLVKTKRRKHSEMMLDEEPGLSSCNRLEQNLSAPALPTKPLGKGENGSKHKNAKSTQSKGASQLPVSTSSPIFSITPWTCASGNPSSKRENGDARSPQAGITTQVTSRKYQKYVDSDSESLSKGSSSSRSSFEYEWVEKTKETLDIEKSTTEVKPSDGIPIHAKSLQVDDSKHDVVSELQKHSRHTFGADVGTWDNTKRVCSPPHSSRKYDYDAYDEELDKGKVRKRKHKFMVKHGDHNPFQEFQNMKNKHGFPLHNKWHAKKFQHNQQSWRRRHGSQNQNGYGHFHKMHRNKNSHFHRR